MTETTLLTGLHLRPLAQAEWLRHLVMTGGCEVDDQAPEAAWSVYDPLEFRQDHRGPIHAAVQEVAGEPIFPTYCYARVYLFGAKLKPHVDTAYRCDVTASVTLATRRNGKHYDWPLIVDGKLWTIPPGAGLIYDGVGVEHSRCRFEGDWSAHVFYHYCRESLREAYEEDCRRRTEAGKRE